MTALIPKSGDKRFQESFDVPLVLRALLAIGCAAFSSGCLSSGKPASASFASVEIRGRSVTQIEETATAVFCDHSYTRKFVPSEWRFEKEGTRTDQMAYGGWLDESRVKVRVRVEIVPLGAGAYRLQCMAWMVKNPGDSHFEEETKLTNLSSHPYQKLLDEVVRRMN
jgi:hypothetical protein